MRMTLSPARPGARNVHASPLRVSATAACVAAAVLVASPRATAQTSSDDVARVSAALAAEQARIAALRAELDERSAVIAELTRRMDAIAAGTVAGAPAAPGQTAGRDTAGTTAPPPAAPALAAAAPPARFAFYGESKVRYETMDQDFPGCAECPHRDRGRLRLRFGAEGHLAPDFTAVFGFGAGDLNDPNTVYTNLGNNFSRKVATWDRGYVEYHPVKEPWIDLTAGKFPYTWLRSSMTFDVDFYPEGMSERFSFDLKRSGALKNVTAQGFQLIVNEQPIDRHMTIVGAQFGARIQTSPRWTTTATGTFVDIDRPELILRALLDGSDIGVRNTNATTTIAGLAFYASGFRYANAIVENAVRTRWEAFPVTVGFEFQRNLQAASDRDTAVSLRFDAGRSQRAGDWELGWHFFRVEQDAILAALGESDWRAPSNVLQHRFAANLMVHPNVQLSWTMYTGRTLERALPGALVAPGLPVGVNDPWTNRMYFDVTYKY